MIIRYFIKETGEGYSTQRGMCKERGIGYWWFMHQPYINGTKRFGGVTFVEVNRGRNRVNYVMMNKDDVMWYGSSVVKLAEFMNGNYKYLKKKIDRSRFEGLFVVRYKYRQLYILNGIKIIGNGN